MISDNEAPVHIRLRNLSFYLAAQSDVLYNSLDVINTHIVTCPNLYRIVNLFFIVFLVNLLVAFVGLHPPSVHALQPSYAGR